MQGPGLLGQIYDHCAAFIRHSPSFSSAKSRALSAKLGFAGLSEKGHTLLALTTPIRLPIRHGILIVILSGAARPFFGPSWSAPPRSRRIPLFVFGARLQMRVCGCPTFVL